MAHAPVHGWRGPIRLLLASLSLFLVAGPATADSPGWTRSADLAAYDGSMDRLVGIWGSDCGSADGSFFVMNRSHVLDISPDGVYYYAMDEGWLNSTDGALSVENDTAIYEFRTEEGARRAEFKRCAGLPPKLSFIHGEAVSFVLEIPDLQEACNRDRPSCVDTLLDRTDMAGTGGLNEADLARLIRIAAYIGAAQDEGMKPGDLGGNQAIAVGLGPLAANLLIRSYDYDADGQVTPQELAADRAGLFGSGSVGIAGEAADGVEDRVREQLERLKGLMRMFQ